MLEDSALRGEGFGENTQLSRRRLLGMSAAAGQIRAGLDALAARRHALPAHRATCQGRPAWSEYRVDRLVPLPAITTAVGLSVYS